RSREGAIAGRSGGDPRARLGARARDGRSGPRTRRRDRRGPGADRSSRRGRGRHLRRWHPGWPGATAARPDRARATRGQNRPPRGERHGAGRGSARAARAREQRWTAAVTGRGRAALIVCGALLALGCRRAKERDPGAEQARPPSGPSAAPAPVPALERQELLARLASCEVVHRGLLFDLGTPGFNARRGFSFGPFTDSVPVDRDGATFERVLTNKLSFDFWLDERIERPMVSLRVSKGTARLLHVSIDDVALGAVRLPKDDIRIVATPGAGMPLEPGRHRVHLRFRGIPRDEKG